MLGRGHGHASIDRRFLDPISRMFSTLLAGRVVRRHSRRNDGNVTDGVIASRGIWKRSWHGEARDRAGRCSVVGTSAWNSRKRSPRGSSLVRAIRRIAESARSNARTEGRTGEDDDDENVAENDERKGSERNEDVGIARVERAREERRGFGGGRYRSNRVKLFCAERNKRQGYHCVDSPGRNARTAARRHTSALPLAPSVMLLPSSQPPNHFSARPSFFSILLPFSFSSSRKRSRGGKVIVVITLRSFSLSLSVSLFLVPSRFYAPSLLLTPAFRETVYPPISERLRPFPPFQKSSTFLRRSVSPRWIRKNRSSGL